MRETMTISLPAEMKKKLDLWAKQEHLKRSDLVQEAIRRFLAIRRFEKIREKTVPRARAHGIFTDEDVFRDIS